MLRTRVITAVAILPVVLGMLFFASSAVWALFVLAIALTGCWEWSRVSRLTARAQAVYVALSAAVGAALWLLYVREGGSVFLRVASVGFCLAALFWIVAAPSWLAKKLRPPPGVCAAAGWLVLWPTWLALVVLRDASPWLLLAMAALVWVADIAAYFAGKAFGKHKLAPAISPGKTWEGVAGGMAGVVVYGLVLCWIAHVYATPLTPIFMPAFGVPALAAMIGLAALSIVGDLFESWMKRGAGLKDSSGLLPGHGGILDRIDALTSTLPVAALALHLSQRGGLI
jgi:phosphatidate cytidylyltransferase